MELVSRPKRRSSLKLENHVSSSYMYIIHVLYSLQRPFLRNKDNADMCAGTLNSYIICFMTNGTVYEYTG